MFTRRTLLAVGVVGALALTACSTDAAPDPGASGSQSIRIASNWSPETLTPLIEAFEAAHEGVTVELETVGGTNVNETIRTQLNSGTAADIITSQPGSSALGVKSLVEAGFILPLTDEVWTDAIEEPYKGLVSVDGDVYSFPGGLQPIAAIYNETATTEVGLVPPTTWSEVLDFCADARTAGKVPFAMGLADPTITLLTTYALVSTLVDGPNPEFEAGIATGASTFADSEWTQALTQFKQLADASCFSDDATGVANDVANDQFTSGAALGIVHLGAAFSTLIGGLPEGTEVTVLPFPAVDDVAELFMPGSLTSGLSVNAKTANPELAKQFLAFLALPENNAAFATSYVGITPLIPSDVFVAPPSLESFNDFVDRGRVTPFSNAFWPNPEVVASLQQNTQALYLGTMTPEEVVAAMDAAVIVSR